MQEMQETWVQSPGQEDPVEEGMTTHSSILAWRIPRTEEPGRYSPWGHRESDMTETQHDVTHGLSALFMALSQGCGFFFQQGFKV